MTPSTTPESGEGLRGELIAAVGGWEHFESSFSWRTHTPPRAARSAIEGAVSDVTTAADAIYSEGGTTEMMADWTARYIEKWVKYQAAGARTSNWMITGPARFPVERNRKRMEVERKRSVELTEFVEGAGAWVRRQQRGAARREAVAADAASGVQHKEKVVNGVRVVLNKALDRVQVIFPDKPSDDERAVLKKHAFRWAPSVGAWQRQLTQSGVWAAEAVLKALFPDHAPAPPESLP